MGKQRFRLSHMIPNAWFYRLRDMNAATTTAISTSNNHPRNSFCYTPKVHSSPSNKNTINRPPSVPKHVLGSIYIRPAHESTHPNQDLFLSPSSSCYESPLFESIPPFDRKSLTCGVIQNIELQKPLPIITKSKMDASTNGNDEEIEIHIKTAEEENDSPTRREKLVLRKKVVVDDEKKFLSSCCIVKSTFDPQNELKESMREMIVDYNIREPKDLEKLLAFYLSLNSNEYHDMIVKAFEEIWLTFDFLV